MHTFCCVNMDVLEDCSGPIYVKNVSKTAASIRHAEGITSERPPLSRHCLPFDNRFQITNTSDICAAAFV